MIISIYPGDLYAYLRKPLFLIVDSASSGSFQNIPNMFGQPFIGLFSPPTLPVVFADKQNQNGSLFTLFLTNPLFGFCTICSIEELSSEAFYKAQQLIRVIFADIAKLFYRSKIVESVFVQVSNDDFLRVFLLRFVFCYYGFRLHKGFRVNLKFLNIWLKTRVVKDSGLRDMSMSKNVLRHLDSPNMSDILPRNMSKNIVVESMHCFIKHVLLILLFNNLFRI